MWNIKFECYSLSGRIWVEWDNGHKNVYHYDESIKKYDIKPINEPRRLVDDLIAVGCKVKRGIVSNITIKESCCYHG